jgi:hypothetical protein
LWCQNKNPFDGHGLLTVIPILPLLIVRLRDWLDDIKVNMSIL